MNKVYKVIWSKVRNCYMVVSELAKRNGKNTGTTDKRRKVTAGLALAAIALTLNLGTVGTAEAVLGVDDRGFPVGIGSDKGSNSVSVGYYETIKNSVKKPGTSTNISTSTSTGAYGSYDIAIGKAAAHGERTSAATGAGTNSDTDIGGYFASSGGEGKAIAVGYDALAVRQHTIAVGTLSMAAGADAIAVGRNARALTPNSVVIGSGDRGNVGIQGNGAINTPLDTPEQGGYSIALGLANNYTQGHNVADDYYANTKNSIAIGYKASASALTRRRNGHLPSEPHQHHTRLPARTKDPALAVKALFRLVIQLLFAQKIPKKANNMITKELLTPMSMMPSLLVLTACPRQEAP